MRKFKIFSIFSVLIILSLTSCKKDDEEGTEYKAPIARFSFNGANTYAPAEVSFTNESLNADSYLWDFGDGSTSDEENPSHVYLQGGSYTVSLKATGKGGNETSTQEIVINNQPGKCKIKKLYLEDVPFIDPSSGSGWDSSSGPDIFYRFLDADSNVLLGDKNNRVENVTQDMLPLVWEWNTGDYWEIPTLTDYYYIDFSDYDAVSSNEYIGSVSYIMSDYMTVENHYPDEISITENDITIKLEIQWED